MFGRLKTFWRGFLNVFWNSVGEAHPEAAYEGVIEGRLIERERLMKAAGMVMAECNKSTNNLQDVKEKLVQNANELKVALRRGESGKQLGIVLISQKQALEKQKADLEPQVARLTKQAKDIKLDCLRFQRGIQELKVEKGVNIARLRSAEAMQRVQDVIDGLSLHSDEKVLAGLRDSIEAKVGMAQIRQEIDSATNIERQLDEVRQEAGKASAEDEFDRLRAAMVATEGTHAAVTPEAGTPGTGKDM